MCAGVTLIASELGVAVDRHHAADLGIPRICPRVAGAHRHVDIRRRDPVREVVRRRVKRHHAIGVQFQAQHLG